MSNKSNNAGSLISLPKGGGALSGLGEKFSPDLHTGTGNFSIPLALPAGRNGFQPQLTLGYSTGQGHGLFGLGWTLSLPGVSRKTSKGLPRYQDDGGLSDEADVFILSGAEDLVPIEVPELGRTRYQPRTEGLFARIERHRNPAQATDYWEVRTKDGLTSFYGTNPLDAPRYPAVPASPSGDPAATSKPGSPERIFSWALTLTLDPFQNRIEYLYDRQRSGPGDEALGHRWDVPVLKMIRYGDHGDRASPGFLVTVEFAYEDRPDPFSDCRAGFEIRQTRRCRSILVKTHAGVERTVKEYRFRYRSDAVTLVSLLEAVEVYGFDSNGGPVLSMPPLELSYTPFEPERRDRRNFFPVRGKELPVVSLAHPTLALVDLHGQGLPDIFELGETVRYWRNLGGGEFDLPRPMREAPAGLSLGDAGVQLLDADGDGRMDLMVTRESMSGYFPLRFGPTWDRRSFRRWDVAPSFDLKDPEVRFLDLTGDGVTDALRTGSRLECYFNEPEKGWRGSRRLERQPLAVFPDVVFSDPRVLTGDMTGDGLTDIVLVHNGSLCYWPSHGYGDFGPRIQMHDGPRLPTDYDPKRLLLGDVNGDGLADLVYVDHRRVYLWINQGGNAWSARIVIEGTPGVTNEDAIRLVDLLGSGVPGILWSSDKVEPGRPYYFFLDLTGGAKPYLLHGMRNNLGAETHVEYRPSTQFYLDDRRRGSTPWKTTLPFPVQTVARVEVMDTFSGGRLVTRYTYHHGYWDGHEREFRGFGRVEQLDAETFADPAGSGAAAGAPPQHTYSPPLMSKSWFHQGPVENEDGSWKELDYRSEQWSGKPKDELVLADLAPTLTSPQLARIRRDAVRSLRGSLLRTELYALDGDPRQDRPYTVTEGVFGFREEAPPEPARAGRSRIFFPHVRAQRTTQWERGDDPMTQLSFTHRHDELGQPLAQTQIACPRGWRALDQRPGAGYLATRTLTAYAAPLSPQGPYIHDRVARSDSFEITATLGKTVAEIIALGDRDPSLRRIGQALSFFDGPAFTGLPLGTIGRYGAVSRSENLVLTSEVMTNAYGTAAPPYLNAGTWTWPAEYPQAFRDALPPLAGYLRHDGSEPGIVEGLFSAGQRFEHDFQQAPSGEGRGLVLRERDSLGHDTTVTYDFELLPASVTDAAGMVTRAAYDLRFFQPSAVTDPNGNRQEFELLPNGLLSAMRVRGKTAVEGDQTRASLQYQYDLFAFQERGAPVSVAAVRFLHHDSDAGTPIAERDATIESREYSDGFGRVLQSRAQGEDLRFGNEIFGGGVLPTDQTAPASADVVGRLATPGIPNVIVSGWQVYDNKGRVVEKYEPFFSEGWDYVPAKDDQRGQRVRMFFDPRGQVIRTVHPDGSEELVVHGVPGTIQTPELSVPAIYEPTPWEAYTYDANDNAGRTFPQSSVGYQHCWNTPGSIEIDALGRTIRAVQRNRSASPAAPLPPTEEYTTRFRYDVQGNLLSIIDALHRVAFAHAYDLAKQPLHTLSLDAGERWFVLNAAGLALETRDAKGALQLQGYDALKRPVRLWARDAQADTVTLRATTMYGDELAPAAQPARQNLLGKPYLAQDGAGRLTFSSYDFKGNLLEKTREVIADLAIAAQVNAGTAMARGFRVDWDRPPALEGSYTTSLRYDALNRITLTTLPADVKGNRQALSPTYNRASALESVSLDGQPYVRHLAYDAKGQRVLAAYGNGYLTRYAYDQRTFRLARLRTETYSVLNGKLSASPEAVTPGLMGWWRFDEPSGATVKDWSGFQNHGKLNNPNQVRQAGKIGNCLTFNGTSDCVDIPVNGMTFPGKAVTLSLWTYGDASLPTATGYGSLVVSAFKTDGNVALTVSIPYTDGSIFFRAGSSDGADTKSTGVLQASQYKGQWNHWVFTKDDEGFVRIYLNGSLVLADPNWGGFGCGTIATFRIGRGTPGKYDASSAYKGMLDEIRLYNYALSATDVTNLYRADSSAGGAPGYTPQAGVLQDFAYDYDLAGNILSIRDRSPNSGIRNAPLGKDALDRDFKYDALYRLTEATGRESMYLWPPQQATANRAAWDRSPQAQGTGFFAPGSITTPDLAPDQTRAYTETYAYDPAGNLLKLWHGTSSSWTRHFGMGGLDPTAWNQAWPTHVQGTELWSNPPSNRLTHVGDNAPATPQTHVFDACGNLVRENGSRHFAWNHADQMIAFSVRPNATAPTSVEACYLYDGSGQRVKKWVRNQSGVVETTVYVDSVFEHSTGSGVSNNTLHVMDGQSRIAIVRIGAPFPDEGAPDLAIKYHFGDHLGSSHVVVGVGPAAQNVLMNREEFYPYGETSYGGFGRKRYRFTGMERDEQSGLQYHSARYYAPWLARWVSADPIGSRSVHLYAYATRNALTVTDRSGKLDQHNTDSGQSQDMASTKGREERVVELPESAWPMSHQEFSERMGMCYNECKRDSQGRVDPILNEKEWVPSGPWKAWKGSWYQEGGSYEYTDKNLSPLNDDGEPAYVMRSGSWYPYRMWANLQKQRSSLFDDTPRQPASITDRLFGWYLRDFEKNLGPPSEIVTEAAAMVSSLMNTLLDLKTVDLSNSISLGAVSTSVGDSMKLQAALTHKTFGAELGLKIGPSLGYGLGASFDRTLSGVHIYGGLGLSLSSYSRLFTTGSESSAAGAAMPLINAKLQIDWP